MTSNFSTRGAVDLQALAARREAQERAEAAAAQRAEQAATGDPEAAAPEVIIDVSDASFRADVVERSMLVPVIIDFWAEWCGPCKELSPILEKLAREYAGAFVLAKMDVDANPGVSGQLQIQSIPTIILAWQGQLMPAFQGAMPEAQVREFMTEVLRVTTGAAAEQTSGEVADDDDVTDETSPDALDLAAAYDAIERRDYDGAEAAYARYGERHPDDLIARAGLGQIALLRRIDGLDAVKAVHEAHEHPDNVEAVLNAADAEFASGSPESAFARLVEFVRTASGDDRDMARARLLQLFDLIDPGDPVVVSARSALANALF